jgi:hypothetical protein
LVVDSGFSTGLLRRPRVKSRLARFSRGDSTGWLTDFRALPGAHGAEGHRTGRSLEGFGEDGLAFQRAPPQVSERAALARQELAPFDGLDQVRFRVGPYRVTLAEDLPKPRNVGDHTFPIGGNVGDLSLGPGGGSVGPTRADTA